MKAGDLARLKISEHRLRKWSNSQDIEDHEWARAKMLLLLIEPHGRLAPNNAYSWGRRWDILTPDGGVRRIDEYLLTTRGVN
jgi:hypothetical protein